MMSKIKKEIIVHQNQKLHPINRLGNNITKLSLYSHRTEKNKFWIRGLCGIVVGRRTECRGSGFDPHKRHHVVSLSKTH